MTDVSVPDLPVPDHLLVPVLEVAADTLRSLDAVDVPGSLRHLHGFDRRGMLHGPAPRQLRRALVGEPDFRSRVRERFDGLPQVESLLSRWTPDGALVAVDDAASRHDLPLLASVLWLCVPDGAWFGLGLVVERDARERRERGDEEAGQAREREIEALAEAQRRADAARMEAEAEAARTLETLREERAGRREREERAASDAHDAQRRAEAIEQQLSEARAAYDDATARVAREAARSRSLEAELARTRSDLTAARARFEQAQSRLDQRDSDALTAAARTAHELAASLDALRRRVHKGATPPEEAAEPRAQPPTRRTIPAVPAGVFAESPEGIEAMLRTPDAMLVVDGYNVSKQAWAESSASDQRERLGIAITGLHRRVGCGVVLVFDGDRSGPLPTLRRGGVRVIFSDADEEADEVVVREVAALPKRVPVVVASSDAWVRQHAEAEGAVVVTASALLGLLRPTR